jgi:pimeloyl-ACP methyl ester carboxylesterase
MRGLTLARRVACGLAVVLTPLAACGEEHHSSGTTSSASPTLSAASPSDVATGETVDVNGHDIHARCRPGSGPSVVFLHGAGGRASDWDATIDRLSGVSPCSYDRFNVGSSGHDEQRHSPAEAAADLEGVLEATGMEPPYILVAHSWGGLLALIEAGHRPETVAGLVLVDATLPFETELDPPDLVDEVRDEVNAFEPGLDAYDGYAAAQDVEAQLPDVPMTYIYGAEQELPWPTKDYESALDAWVATWPQGRLVRCECGHGIPGEQPELVVEEIRAVLQAAS